MWEAIGFSPSHGLAFSKTTLSVVFTKMFRENAAVWTQNRTTGTDKKSTLTQGQSGVLLKTIVDPFGAANFPQRFTSNRNEILFHR